MAATYTPIIPERGREERIAVLLPCYNEAVTIGRVVADFREALPAADIYVFDNRSDDNTAEAAAAAGASVVLSPRRGKGNVVRHMFETVDADVYVMADGDGTYPADASIELIRELKDAKADMVVGMRLGDYAKGAFRTLHVVGNRFMSRLVSMLFEARITDILSGYRVFDRRFLRTLHLQSTGFEIEAEITLQALISRRVIREVPVRYGERPKESRSKLNTFSDGMLVIRSVLLIFRDYKPLVFFSWVGGICFVLGLAAGWYPVDDYIRTHYVSHVPLALLAAALEVLAVLFLGIGLILDAIKRYHLETRGLIEKAFERIDRDREQH